MSYCCSDEGAKLANGNGNGSKTKKITFYIFELSLKPIRNQPL